MASEKIAPLDDVLAKRGIRKSKHYDDVNHGRWTRPVKTSGKRVGWPDSENDVLLVAYIADWPEERIKRLVDKLHEKRETKAAAIAARLLREAAPASAPDQAVDPPLVPQAEPQEVAA